MGIDVSHAMFGEDVPVPLTQEAGAAAFDSIAKVGGQLAKKVIKSFAKILSGQPVTGELEQERAGMRLKCRFTKWPQNHLLEELGVEKARVRLAGPDPMARVLGKAGDGQLIPHLEAHVKILGNLFPIAQQLIGIGRTAEPCVIADG